MARNDLHPPVDAGASVFLPPKRAFRSILGSATGSGSAIGAAMHKPAIAAVIITENFMISRVSKRIQIKVSKENANV